MTMHVRRVKTPCGGDLVFSLENANPLAWPRIDRDFFFALVDALNTYEDISRTKRDREAQTMLTRLRQQLELSQAADEGSIAKDSGGSLSSAGS